MLLTPLWGLRLDLLIGGQLPQSTEAAAAARGAGHPAVASAPGAPAGQLPKRYLHFLADYFSMLRPGGPAA